MTPPTLSFFIPGIPKPGGSKRYVGKSKAGRAILIDASGKAGVNWRQTVQVFAVKHIYAPILDGPIELDIEFIMPRPKHHYLNNGVVKPTAPLWHTIAPDTTKLIRSLEDALKGIAWKDDSQVVRQHAVKRYGELPGASVYIAPVTRKPSIT